MEININHVITISPELKDVLLHLHGAPTMSQMVAYATKLQEKIREKFKNMPNEIENLRTAVNSVQTTTEAGNAALESAFAELASDIAALPGASDVGAEAARLSAQVTQMQAASVAFAQRLRDAVPTAPPTDPLPPVDEEVPAPPDTTGGGTDPNVPPVGGDGSGTGSGTGDGSTPAIDPLTGQPVVD